MIYVFTTDGNGVALYLQMINGPLNAEFQLIFVLIYSKNVVAKGGEKQCIIVNGSYK